MQHQIKGSVLQVLEIELDPGESVVSEDGEFSWMTDNVQMTTNTGMGAGGKGLFGAVKRMAGGGTFLFNTFTAEGATGMVAFAAKLPGAILPIDLDQEYLAHRHGFLAGTPGVEISVALQQSFRGGIFGGEGFLLQKIGGSGQAWIELSGEVMTYDLQAGQTMKVHPGHVGLFQSSVSFQVIRVPGIANRYMGDDGHHWVVLSGPGRVWLQSMPIPILAGAMAPYLGGEARPAAAGAAGGAVASALGNILGGR
ncbi:MAG: TIGR00266 family protein [Acidimicrobiales bacterium]